MALTKTVTRVFPDANRVGYRLVLKNGIDVVIDKFYMEQFAFGLDIPAATKTEIGRRMQDDIDAYKKALAVYENEIYIEGEGQISAGLDV